jgi:hypothetical protein
LLRDWRSNFDVLPFVDLEFEKGGNPITLVQDSSHDNGNDAQLILFTGKQDTAREWLRKGGISGETESGL